MPRLTITKRPFIEVPGTRAVPETARSCGVYSVFVIMINFLINPASIITAAMGVAGGLPFLTVVLVQTISVMLSMLAFLVMARIGVDYGLTGQMACRAALGVRGGRWITSPLRALCSIYWFAFQTLAGSLAIQAIVAFFPGWQVGLIQVSLVFALLQVLVACIGYHWLRGLFYWALPLKLTSLVAIVIMLLPLAQQNEVDWPRTDIQQHWLLLMVWFNAIFGGMLTMITDAADMMRYINSRRALRGGVLTGSFAGIVLGAGFGAWVMTVVGGNDAGQLFQSMLDARPGAGMAMAILALIVMDNWTINVINLYTGGLSLCHTLEPSSRFKCTLLVSIPAVLLSCFPEVIDQYLQIMEKAGLLFAAIAGVLLVDYIRRCWVINVSALYQNNGEYWYQQGVNITALLIITVATLVAAVIPPGWPAPVLALLLAGAGYNSACTTRL